MFFALLSANQAIADGMGRLADDETAQLMAVIRSSTGDQQYWGRSTGDSVSIVVKFEIGTLSTELQSHSTKSVFHPATAKQTLRDPSP